ncbi:peptide synthetase, partial [Kitasatospora sp. NPDC093102]
YGLLRYLNPTTAPTLADQPTPQLGFNYLGRFSTAQSGDWERAPESEVLDATANEGMPMPHSISLNAVTHDLPDGEAQLTATWSYPGALLQEQEVRELAELWFEALEGLVRHTRTPGAGGYTPSDLSLVSLSQDEIDELESEWSL